MIFYHLRDIGGYRITVGYICCRGKEPCDDINGGRTESMRRLTHVILSVPIKDRTVVGASDKIKRMPIT